MSESNNQGIKTLTKIKSDSSNKFFKYSADTSNTIIDNINSLLIPSINAIIGVKTENLQAQIDAINVIVDPEVPPITLDGADDQESDTHSYSPMNADSASGL